MKLTVISISFFSLLFLLSSFFTEADIKMKIDHSLTIDSLGACQGVSYQHKNVYLYGDREVGMIREFALSSDSVIYLNNQCKLTIGGKNVINHPTGIAYNGRGPTFMGNSIRLNKEGTAWILFIISTRR